MAEAGAELHGSLQENILTLLCWDQANHSIIRGSIPLTLYSNSLYRRLAEVSYQFIDQFKHPPGEHLPDLLEKEMETEEGELYKDKIRNMRLLYKGGVNIEFIVSKLNDFIGEYNLRTSIIAASRSLTNGEPWTVARDIIDSSKKVRGNLVTSTVMDQGIMDVIVYQNRPDRVPILLNIPEFDKKELGPARGELWTAVGGPKSGKTAFLLHLAKQAAMQRWKVFYVSLEVSEEEIIKRMAQSVFGFKRRVDDKVMRTMIELNTLGGVKSLQQHEMERDIIGSSTARNAIKEGISRFRFLKRMRVKDFATGSINVQDLETYLDLMEASQSFSPDLLIVDYPDLMKIPSNEQYRLSLGTLYKDLRGLATSRNMAVAVASQTNRKGASNILATALDIGEDFTKIATSDVVITINAQESERRLGFARLYVAASRISEAHFSVLVTQSLTTGQFMLKSYPTPTGWNAFVKTMGGDSGEGEQAEEETQRPKRRSTSRKLNGKSHDSP